MKKLQIACVPENWNASTITAVGMCRNGRRALPVTTVAAELPQPWLTIWYGMVDTLRGVAPGEWAATYITAERVDLPAEHETDVPQAAVQLTIHRRWDDATTAVPVTLTMETAEAINFFDYLTTPN